MASAIIQKLNQNEPNLETQNPLTNIASELLEKISHEGLGYMSKADLETFIFHLYMKNLEYPLSDYDLMSLFKISSSKLRALETNRSIKYLQLDLNDKDNRQLLINFFADVVQRNAFEFPDDENGCVKFYVPHTHIYRIIEKYVVDNGSSPNYRPNPKQMEIKYSHLINLLKEVFTSLNKSLTSFCIFFIFRFCIHLVIQYKTPCITPQRIKFHPAPCQIPLKRNTRNKLAYMRAFPLRFPPRGI